MQVKRGATRIVFIFEDRFVVKIPNTRSWSLFLRGLLGNLQERVFGASKWKELCPVLASCPLGFWLIMPYAEPLRDEEWVWMDYDKFVDREDYRVPAERKQDSFGMLNGRIVAIDYGS